MRNSKPVKNLNTVKEENRNLRAQIKELQERLNVDPLTKALSKSGFYDCFEREAKKGDALYFIDIDDFKSVNDLYGHDIGDSLLFKIAQNLILSVGAAGKVGRLAGDEFLVLMPIQEARDLDRCANSLHNAAASSRINFGGVPISRNVSIGFVVIDEQLDPEHAVINANSALRAAKVSGKNQAKIFKGKSVCEGFKSPGVDELRLGLQRNEIGYFTQPIFDIDSGKCFAHEALLRWTRNNCEILGPGYFLDNMTAAYNHDTVPPLAAAHAVAKWVTLEQKKKISFNISAEFLSKFIDEGPDWINEIVGGVPYDMIIFELVEAIVDGDNKKMSKAVSKLRELGIRIAIDDFGIAHSTLHRLQEIHVDYVKVDRHFLEAASLSDRAKDMLQSIIDLIHKSGAAAIIEGIEDHCQLAFVKSCGAAFGQGFFLGRPGPITAWDVSDPDHPVLLR